MDVLRRPPVPPAASVPAPAGRAGTAGLPARRGARVPGWRSSDVLRAAAVVFGLYLTLRLVWVAHPLLLAAFLGVLFGLAVSRGADFLVRWHIPRGIAAALLVFAFYGLIAGLIAFSAPTLRAQFRELGERLPEATQRIDDWIQRHEGDFLGQLVAGARDAASEATAAQSGAPAPAASSAARPGGTAPAPAQGGRPAAEAAPGAGPGARPQDREPARGQAAARSQGERPAGATLAAARSTLSEQVGAIGRYLFSFLSSTLAVIAGLLLITFITIYVGAEPDLYRSGLLHLVPHRSRERAAEVLRAIGSTLRRWLLTQLIAMVVIGVVTTVVLWMMNVKAALLLGIIAGLLEFIPNVGPVLSALPAMGMAFVDSPQKAVWVAVAYLVIQQLEGHLLIPLLMKRQMDLPPALTLVGEAVMAFAFGFLGLLVSVPLIAAILVAVKMLYVEDVVGDETGVEAEAHGAA